MGVCVYVNIHVCLSLKSLCIHTYICVHIYMYTQAYIYIYVYSMYKFTVHVCWPGLHDTSVSLWCSNSIFTCPLLVLSSQPSFSPLPSTSFSPSALLPWGNCKAQEIGMTCWRRDDVGHSLSAVLRACIYHYAGLTLLCCFSKKHWEEKPDIWFLPVQN